MLPVPVHPFAEEKKAQEDAQEEQFDTVAFEYRQKVEMTGVKENNTLKNGHCMRNAIGPKENPGNHSQTECANHHQKLFYRRQVFAMGDYIQVGTILVCEHQRKEVQRIQRTPDDERPIGAMPKTADDEDDEYIPDLHYGIPATPT